MEIFNPGDMPQTKHPSLAESRFTGRLIEMLNPGDMPQNVLVTEHPSPANPKFTDSIKRALERLSHKTRFNLDFVSSPRNEAEANQLIRETESGTEIIVLAGDGVLNSLYSSIYNLEEKSVRLSALGGGGACDFARQTHPIILASTLTNTLRSPALAHKPLVTTVEHPDIDTPDNKIKMISSIYFDLGFTARMASRYNSPEFRESVKGIKPTKRKYIQLKEIFKNINHADLFDIEYEDGSTTEVGEYVFTNGSRMAGGLVRFNGNSLFAPKFGEMAVGEINYPTFTKSLAKAALGLYQKHYDGEEVRFKVTSKDEAPILYQSDGESGTFPSGSIVSIGLGKAIVQAVTSNAFHIGLERAA